jgi:hypothetical protein
MTELGQNSRYGPAWQQGVAIQQQHLADLLRFHQHDFNNAIVRFLFNN